MCNAQFFAPRMIQERPNSNPLFRSSTKKLHAKHKKVGRQWISLSETPFFLANL